MRVESEKGVFLLHLSLHNRLFSLSGPHFPHLKKIRGTPLSRWRIKKAQLWEEPERPPGTQCGARSKVKAGWLWVPEKSEFTSLVFLTCR